MKVEPSFLMGMKVLCCRTRIIVFINAEHHQAMFGSFAVEVLYGWHGLDTRTTPCGPEVEQRRLTLERFEREYFAVRSR